MHAWTERTKQKHNNCFENKISISRGYASTTKKSVALKKNVRFFFLIQDLWKKNSTKITSVKLKKKEIKARTSSKQLLYLRKKVFVIQQKLWVWLTIRCQKNNCKEDKNSPSKLFFQPGIYEKCQWPVSTTLSNLKLCNSKKAPDQTLFPFSTLPQCEIIPSIETPKISLPTKKLEIFKWKPKN